MDIAPTSRTPTDPAAALRAAGLQVTAQRLAALRAVDETPHARADDIRAAVNASIGTVSRQAVYDALRILVDKGLLRRIQPAGSTPRYESRVGDNHHHLVCRSCDAVIDIACAAGHTPCLAPDHDHGYLIDEAEVVYWGVCPACQDGDTRRDGGKRSSEPGAA